MQQIINTSRIPAVKTGTDFLASSHFNIGNEPPQLWKQDPLAYRSTFQNDYSPKDGMKSGLVHIPPPAVIMHHDPRIHDQCSVTRNQFIPKELTKSNYARNSLTKTNFKMDRDYRIDTFQTTQEAYYTPKLENVQKPVLSNNPMKSHIPQGDKEKRMVPESSYRASYQNRLQDVMRNDQNKNLFHANSNTIQGDNRIHACGDMFNTTSRTVFPVHHGSRKIFVGASIKYPETSIPCGEKLQLESTHQAAFKEKLLASSFNRNKALSNLQKTTFKNGDNRLDAFQTTTNNCFTAKPLSKKCVPVITATNSSCFPQGDLHILNTSNRTASSVNRIDFKSPPKEFYRRNIVDGSDLRAVSNISFGNDNQKYHKTTMESSFPYKFGKYEKATADTCHSSIPINYYGKNLICNSSYRMDYLPTNGVKKLVPNPLAVQNLVKSHIDKPICDYREFQSTHADTYTSKGPAQLIKADSSRLQKSSVPIGTLCH